MLPAATAAPSSRAALQAAGAGFSGATETASRILGGLLGLTVAAFWTFIMLRGGCAFLL